MEKKKRNLIVILLIVLVIILILLTLFFMRNKKQTPTAKISEENLSDSNIEKTITKKPKPSMLPLDVKTENDIKKILDENEKKGQKKRGRSNRGNASTDYTGSTDETDVVLSSITPPDIDDSVDTSSLSVISKGDNINKFIVKNQKLPPARVYFDYGSSLEILNSKPDIKSIIKSIIEKDKNLTKAEYEFLEIIFTLNNIVKKIPDNDNVKIQLIGRADPSYWNGVPEISERSDAFNTDLSKKRANAIKTILVELFLAKDSSIATIVMEGLGYHGYENETSELWRYRYVDIYVTW